MMAWVFGLGQWEILIILVVMLLFFGARLPEVGRSLGRSLVEFKKGLKGVEDEMEKAGDEEEEETPAEKSDKKKEEGGVQKGS